jgi:hypothetical protein
VPIQVVNLYVMMVVKLQTLGARLASVATRGCVSTRVVGSLKLGMSNAKVGCVVHTFLVCYTYAGVCVLFWLDAELHESKRKPFWLALLTTTEVEMVQSTACCLD